MKILLIIILAIVVVLTIMQAVTLIVCLSWMNMIASFLFGDDDDRKTIYDKFREENADYYNNKHDD